MNSLKALIAVATLMLSASASAGTVLPPLNLTLASPDGTASVAGLNVTVSVSCSYKEGIFWPESKSCGSAAFEFQTDANGQVQTGAIERFEGWKASKLDNYDVSVIFRAGEKSLFQLAARGKKQIESLSRLNQVLNLVRVEPAVLQVTANGENLFGSGLSKVDRASFFFSIDKPRESESFDDFMIVDSYGSRLTAYENFKSYAGKVQLEDIKELSIPESHMVYVGSVPSITIRTWYSQMRNMSTHEPLFEKRITRPLTSDLLSGLGRIDLEPVPPRY